MHFRTMLICDKNLRKVIRFEDMYLCVSRICFYPIFFYIINVLTCEIFVIFVPSYTRYYYIYVFIM